MPSVFSRRASWSLVPNRPHQVRLTLEAAGRPLLDLTRTNTTRLGFPYPRESLAAALSGEGIHRYDPDPSGSRRARGVLAAHLSRDRQAIDPDHIVLFSSTSEAYGCLFRVLADPGDTVLQPRPGYPLFEHLTRLDALKLESYDLAYCGG